MEKNLHPLDRYLRGVIGVSVIGFALFNDSYLEEPILEILLILFGTLNLISLVSSWCPVYHLTGISTCKTKK
jgi:hypothetical protein